MSIIQLDQNAGLLMNPELLEIYNFYAKNVNNINGYGMLKRKTKQEIEDLRKKLCKYFHMDRVFFTSGATSTIELLFKQIPGLEAMEGQHVSVEDLQGEQERVNHQGPCLICYVSGSDSKIQYEQLKQAGDRVVILDISQALGKVEIPINVDCVFFSCHKLGGPFGTGFIACKSGFYTRYLQTKSDVNKLKRLQQTLDVQHEKENFDLYLGGTFNVPGYMSAAQSVLITKPSNRKQMYQTYLGLLDILQKRPNIFKSIQPIIKDDIQLNDYPNAFSSILFQLDEKFCARSFQGYLEDNGVQIGFKSACQAGRTGILRMSWRSPLSPSQISKVDQVISKTLNEVEKKMRNLNGGDIIGGKKLYTNFLEEINQNKFWLIHHFVPSHDAEPMIDKKYADMFQPDLLKQDRVISLKIPAHNKVHFEEETILKQKANDEDFDFENDHIRIQNRRISKYLWINRPRDQHSKKDESNKQSAVEFELSLENFQTEKMKVYLTDQVFRSVDDNLLFKKKFPSEYQEEANEYEITYKLYPDTLLQEIIIDHPKPEITSKTAQSLGRQSYKYFEDTGEQQSEPSSSSEIDWEETTQNNLKLRKEKGLEIENTQENLNEEEKIQESWEFGIDLQGNFLVGGEKEKWELKKQKEKMRLKDHKRNRYELTEGKKDELTEGKKDELTELTKLTGGKRDPDYIRPQIKFMISLYNLKLLSFLDQNSKQKNNLSIAILTNLDKLYRRGEKPSKYYKPHQQIVVDTRFQYFQNCLGTLLTSMNLMKEIDSSWPNSGKTFKLPESKFQTFIEQPFSEEKIDSEKIIIQQLNEPKLNKIQELISEHQNLKTIVVYLPHINTDEIEQDYGIYYWFKQNGFKYEIDNFSYYDIWDHVYRTDKQIVMFIKTGDKDIQIKESEIKKEDSGQEVEIKEVDESDASLSGNVSESENTDESDENTEHESETNTSGVSSSSGSQTDE